MKASDTFLMRRWRCLQNTRGPVPEAPKKLAGGEARNERNHRNPKRGSTRPEGGARIWPGISGAASGAHSILVGFRWLRSFLASPPANFRCASGAFSNDDRAGNPPDLSVLQWENRRGDARFIETAVQSAAEPFRYAQGPEEVEEQSINPLRASQTPPAPSALKSLPAPQD